MGISPIFSNIPILKSLVNFTSKLSPAEENKEKIDKQPKDIIEISDLAKKQLDGIKPLTIKSDGELRTLLNETKEILSNSGASFGIDISSLNT